MILNDPYNKELCKRVVWALVQMHVGQCVNLISDMNNFAEINAVYGTYFNEATAPARETVEVANLPKFVNVEISMIAIKYTVIILKKPNRIISIRLYFLKYILQL